MSGFDFEQLKDVDFSIPDSWMENALNAPCKRRKAAAPVRFYRFAIGVAACVVLAAAVIFSLVFGFNKDVNLTNPEPDISLIAVQTTTECTSEETENGSTTAEKPIKSTEDNTAAVITEPAEDGRSETETVPKPAGSNPSKNEGAEGNTSQHTISGISSAEDTTGSSGKAAEAEQPETTQTACLSDATNPQGETFPPGCVIKTRIDLGLVSGTVYCRLVDSEGKTIGSEDLYSASHIAEAKETVNGKITLTYNVSDSEVKEGAGKELYAVFYDSRGNILKKSNILYTHENLYFFFA